MKINFRLFIILLLTAHCLLLTVAAQTPTVSKVEPPNWWANHSISTVRVLVRGENLGGANVSTPANSGLRTGNVKTSANGHYLFVDVAIDRSAKAGNYNLKIGGNNGFANAPFEILPKLAADKRFQGFNQDDVIYLIMPDRFADGDTTNDDPAISKGIFDRAKPKYFHGGDLQGVIDRLDYLKELGVTAVWLNPWYDNNNGLNKVEMPEGVPITDYHGYGAIDYYAVEEHFGTMQKLRELVDAAHVKGIKVIQDQVANHTGPYHPWVEDAPLPDWYNGTKAKHINETWQTWSLIDPNAPAATQNATLNGWFLDILPDLNQDEPEVAKYEIQNSLWWIGMSGIDAIRQDTLPYVHRRFWRDWTTAIKREYPRFTTLGEVYDADPAMTAFFQGGAKRFDNIDSGVDTVFDFPLNAAIRKSFASEGEVREIPKLLAHDYLYPNPNLLVTFLGLHDMQRFMSEPNASAKGLMLAQTLLMTTRGVPMLYYADEIGMTGAGDPDNRRDFPGGWPDDARNAFTAKGRSIGENEIFNHVKKLTALRRELEPLRGGKLVNLLTDAAQQYAFARVSDSGQTVIVVFNNAKTPAQIEFPLTAIKVSDNANLIDRMSVSTDARIEKGTMKLTVAGRAAGIFTVR